MRMFFGVILIACSLLLFCACNDDNDQKTVTPTSQTLTWDASAPTWDNGKWN
jgi:hypothetical protein